ncbi:tRNA pseudouridine(13) synthase TruD [Candidatus Woesearchaeota archaeon]|nr:tRNA pseudouridine(13) synthase TruD [Candidatus Woesearchaeota archaeon]
MYKIKESPKDFIVKEIPDYDLDRSGDYSYFWLIKKNTTTMDAVKRIADRLKIPLKNIGFAGTKDKKAITKQTVSIKKIKKEKIESLNLKDIKLEFIGKSSSPISLGDLKGNEFVITVRNITKDKIKPKEIIPNLFGPQRFSTNNIEIGKAIIKRNLEKALKLIDKKEVQKHLEKFPGDYIGALRKIPLKIRRIYIHAYQSMLWNKTVKKYINLGHHQNIKIPIIGFGTNIKSIEDEDLKKIIKDILSKEEITTRDFILPAIKELSAEGDKRDLFMKIQNLEIETKKDRAIVSFSLPKGSYATVVIEEIFNS